MQSTVIIIKGVLQINYRLLFYLKIVTLDSTWTCHITINQTVNKEISILISEINNDSIAMRIRGKSNIIEVKTGSLKHTIYEQNNYISMKQKRKIANNRRRKMEMLERYKEERLINELRIIKEQKKVLKEQQKLEIIKERRRYVIDSR